eukprot:1757182-Amphidinium_carterae.1
MEHTLSSLAGSIIPCPWQPGCLKFSANSCPQRTLKRPGSTALTRSGWWNWGGPPWRVPYWALSTSPLNHTCHRFGRWPRIWLRVAVPVEPPLPLDSWQ